MLSTCYVILLIDIKTLFTRKNRLINSEGVDVEYNKTGANFSITLAVYSEGAGSEGFRYRSTVYLDDLKLLDNITEVSELTSKTLKPGKIEPGEYNLVLAPDAASDILSVIGFAVNADNVRKKRSPWIDKIEQKVASESLTVIDDGLLPRGLGTAPCDGEGYPMRRKTVIENGILKTYLYDYYTARLMNTESTGNSASSRPLPSISPTNIIVKPGRKSLEELIGEMGKGVYIPRLPPSFMNPVTSDFSAELRQAFIIENGEIGKPVRWGMVTGNAYNMLKKILEIGNDQTMIGSFLIPSIAVEGIRIVG
ncbi:MAG: TldD/PmbA family protein [Caldisphaeraceae archaeon]|nr:TldD/PmbA family protein [Caldisphaeraceae archaeon]